MISKPPIEPLGMQHVACGLVVIHFSEERGERKILLGKRSSHRKSCPNRWDIFGGHLEAGETPAEALVREIREELGVTATEYRELKTITELRPEFGEPATLHMYLVAQWAGQIKMLGDEHTELRWFTLQEAAGLPDLAHPDYPEMFNALLAVRG